MSRKIDTPWGRVTPIRAQLLDDVDAGLVEHQARAWWHTTTGYRITRIVDGAISAGLVTTGPGEGWRTPAILTDRVSATLAYLVERGHVRRPSPRPVTPEEGRQALSALGVGGAA